MEFIDALTEYWYVIISIIGVIVSYVELKAQNLRQEIRIQKLEDKNEELNPILLEIRTKLASIEATLQFLIKK